MANIHEVKCLPEYFTPIRRELKKFEIRKNDRDYQVGDGLIIREWDNINGYSGNVTRTMIVYITDYEQKEGYVVMSIRLLGGTYNETS